VFNFFLKAKLILDSKKKRKYRIFFFSDLFVFCKYKGSHILKCKKTLSASNTILQSDVSSKRDDIQSSSHSIPVIENGIALVQENRSYIFSFETSQEKEEWAQVITETFKEAKKRASGKKIPIPIFLIFFF